MVITKLGQMVRVAATDISKIGRGTQGVRVVRLDEGDEVVAATRITAESNDGAGGAPPPADASAS
ncbi:MAG: DNA gyrase C-terminal beta-propeller domain-containing protein [Phycisphaerales bacterium]